MPALRILVVDDSVVIRQMISQILTEDAELAVAGVAGDGKIALAKIPQTTPDLVTLDVEMPVMNGLETLAEIRKLYPKLPVVMFSTLTERGATATIEALSLGASDYVTKPSNTMSQDEARQRIRAELIPKIKALCRKQSFDLAGNSAIARPARAVSPSLVEMRKANASSTSNATAGASTARGEKKRIELVAIGTSTGGPNALAAVLPLFPKDFPVPIVIVQHMPPIFTRMLAERLDSRSAISVREGAEATVLEPGVAYIAPGDFHMTVKKLAMGFQLKLNQEPQENSCRPAVDVLFRSVAQICGPQVLGVVMTGMGSDGVRGSEHIKHAGGDVIVQDEKTSVVWGMPGFTFNEGFADAAYPLDRLQAEITRRVVSSRATASATSTSASSTSTQTNAAANTDRKPAVRVI
jgi:two-component system, chemotaxis family, protein-glutamate methylesterase/glutaminase